MAVDRSSEPGGGDASQPASHRISIERNGLYVRLEIYGVLSVQRIEAAILEVLDMEEFSPGIGTLWDLRSADVSGLSSGDLQYLRRSRRALAERRGHSRVALLAADDLTFGISRMVEAATEVPGVRIMVFRDDHDAVHWVCGGNNPGG